MSIQNKSFQGSLCCKVKKKQNDKDRPKDPSGCLKTSGGSALIVAETISLCLNSWFCEMLKILGCFSFEVYITSNTTYIVYDKLLLAYKKVNWSQSTLFFCVCAAMRLTWEIERGPQLHQCYVAVVGPVVVVLVVDDLLHRVSCMLSCFSRAASHNASIDHPAGYLR